MDRASLEESGLHLREAGRAFGDGGLPARVPRELVADLCFVASRLKERTFRGLVAGPLGTSCAEQFKIDQFPRLRALVARLMKVMNERAEVV